MDRAKIKDILKQAMHRGFGIDPATIEDSRILRYYLGPPTGVTADFSIGIQHAFGIRPGSVSFLHLTIGELTDYIAKNMTKEPSSGQPADDGIKTAAPRRGHTRRRKIQPVATVS
jgi:hypothetical protein